MAAIDPARTEALTARFDKAIDLDRRLMDLRELDIHKKLLGSGAKATLPKGIKTLTSKEHLNALWAARREAKALAELPPVPKSERSNTHAPETILGVQEVNLEYLRSLIGTAELLCRMLSPKTKDETHETSQTGTDIEDSGEFNTRLAYEAVDPALITPRQKALAVSSVEHLRAWARGMNALTDDESLSDDEQEKINAEAQQRLQYARNIDGTLR